MNDVHRLFEEIPNKVQSLLGIIVEVNLKSECGLEYLEIVVEPHPRSAPEGSSTIAPEVRNRY
ncbi:MAG: hypothetical protein F4Y37_10875 [Caldilineaceae bacterium SB0664_bin_22]|nr:hypothetical protein [Caldilineaceae bacterium SB0664_bin_22]